MYPVCKNLEEKGIQFRYLQWIWYAKNHMIFVPEISLGLFDGFYQNNLVFVRNIKAIRILEYLVVSELLSSSFIQIAQIHSHSMNMKSKLIRIYNGLLIHGYRWIRFTRRKKSTRSRMHQACIEHKPPPAPTDEPSWRSS
jgi:hypothetical protein